MISRNILVALFCLPMLSGCSSSEPKQGVVWQGDLPTKTQTWDEFRASRTHLGSDGKAEYEILDDVVTEDVADLRAYYDDFVNGVRDKSTGVFANGAWVRWNKHVLSYCVASDSNWGTPVDPNRRNYIRALMVRAAPIWSRAANIAWVENNALGSGCETNEPSAGHVDFTIVAGNSTQQGGNSFFPDAAVGSRKFYINTPIFNLQSYSDWVNSRVIADPSFVVHELGHISGLDHEQATYYPTAWAPSPPVSNPDNSKCNDLHGNDATITSIDYCSVMATYACDMSYDWQVANCHDRFVTFATPHDEYGMRFLYGMPAWYATVASSSLL